VVVLLSVFQVILWLEFVGFVTIAAKFIVYFVIILFITEVMKITITAFSTMITNVGYEYKFRNLYRA